MVLRELRSAVVRRVLRADGHREAVPAPVRALLREHRASHLQTLQLCHGAGALKARVQWEGCEITTDLSQPIEIAIPLDFSAPQPRHFGAPSAGTHPYSVPGFSGSVAAGASCNCNVI